MSLSKRATKQYWQEMSQFINVLDAESPDFIADYERGITLSSLADEMSRLAKTYHRLQENACMYELSKWQLGRERNIEARINEIVQLLKLTGVIFNGDPRGMPIKLILPSGKTNDWGQEGYCVPIWGNI